MARYSPLVEELIKSLKVLPGVGAKSAQRMAFNLLQYKRKEGTRLAQALELAMRDVKHCASCRNFTEAHLCEICQSPRRVQAGVICVVETPQDVVAIENTAEYQGSYFVLMGHLSPIDGVGPQELGLDLLAQRLDDTQPTEVILATNTTMEGEATAHYLAQMCRKREIKATRIAHGVPLGGELEYVDGNTLSHALSGRKVI